MAATRGRGRPPAPGPAGRRLGVALLLGVAWALSGGGVVGHAAAWRPPVGGAVIAPFDFDHARPYAAGRRRGLELAARRGEPVRSACGGEVTFAGRLPGGGLGVTVRCGSLAATHLGLAGAPVRRGARVRRGATLGTAAGGSVRLGARRIGERHGYVDPAGLLASGPSAAPPVVPVRSPPRRPPAAVPQPLPAPRPLPTAEPPPAAQPPPRRRRPVGAPEPRAGAVPLIAWAGLALLAIGVPAGGLLRARRGGGVRARRGGSEPARELAGERYGAGGG
jgi:hypothetical protein